MRLKRATAAIAGLVVLTCGLLAAGLVWLYLTEYGQRRVGVAVAIAVFGAVAAVAIALLVIKLCRRPRCTALVLAAVVIIALTPAVSAANGRITYSRFGLSVYGLIPVPTLDITIGPRGGLWFRDKSHNISLDEVQSLLALDVEVLVIGTGWHEGASVDPAIEELSGIEVHILPTPEAFSTFNELVTLGRCVALLAHTTC